MKLTQIISLDDYLGDSYGLFEKMAIPFLSEYDELDLLYSAHSGEKTASPLVLKLGNTDEGKQRLANIIKLKYYKNWQYIYDALMADYNPIYNYGMEEKEVIDTDKTNNSVDTHNYKTTQNQGITTSNQKEENRDITTDTTNTNTKDTTQATEENQDDLNSVYAYDSEDATKSQKSETTAGSTVKDSGTVKDEGQSTQSDDSTTTEQGSTELTDNSTDTGDLTVKGADTEDTIRTLTREGNIGVTTSQQMIESELELRKKNLYDIIFKDMDKVLTLRIYLEEEQDG